MRVVWLGLALAASGCSSILGIGGFHLGDAGAGDDVFGDDAFGDDAPADADPRDAAPGCFGPGGWVVCLNGPAPTMPETLNAPIDTNSSPVCSATATFVSAGQPSACIVVATSITVGGNVLASGARPLVLLSTGSIVFNSNALLDVASHRGGQTGAGTEPMGCGAFPQLPMKAVDGGGGGAAGSYMTKGGDGGAGGNGALPGLAPNAVVTNPIVLRGGCKGQTGGDGQNAGNAGLGSAGGGAVYLLAVTSIALDGTINASGAGAGGGDSTAGGGGAGTGGTIVLHAPTITALASAKLIANGGGGGGGGGSVKGGDGFDPSTTTPTLPAQGGSRGGGNGCGQGSSGQGGTGYANGIAATAGNPGATNNQCGGAGGGGAGGYIRSNLALGTAIVTPPVTIVP